MRVIVIKLIEDATTGAINKLGIASVVTGLSNPIVNNAIENHSEAWLTISNAVAIFSIVGSGMFIIKICVDIYFARKKDKREQERHDIDNSAP